ncbi:MAG: LysR family transcriptional regulator [Myxococcota bacterium]
MQHWVEFHTAYVLALQGTASAAAEVLGIHRSTVIRHIEALEEHVGLKLFYRHSKGYTTTESGEELIRSGKSAEHEYRQFLGRMALRRTEVLGQLIVCTSGPISTLLLETARRFRADYPADPRARRSSRRAVARSKTGNARLRGCSNHRV